MASKPFRIAMIPSQNGGVNYYRLATWAFQMRKYRNVEVGLFGFQYNMNEIHPWQRDFQNNPYVRHDIDLLCDAADIVVWHPVNYDDTLDFFLEMRHKHDKPMLLEIDDNYLDVPEWSEAFNAFQGNSNFRRVAVDHMRNADGLIVTTPHLKETYAPVNEHVQIVENSLDFKGDGKFIGWDKVSVRNHKGVRIGWIAGRAHFNDLMMVAPALRQVLEKNPEVTLCLVNSALQQSCHALGIPYPFEGLANVHYADRSVPINRYAAFAASFGFDIGIAPLVDCNFNRSKSNLRWLEYSAMGIPTVATDISHFNQTIKHGIDGFLVKDNDLKRWATTLTTLIEDEDLRTQVGRAAHKRVRKDFNVQRNAATYVRHLKTVANQAIPGDLDQVPDFSFAMGVN